MDCEKKDCVHFNLCIFDLVYRFLCGKNKDYYGVVPSQLQFTKIQEKLKEIEKTPSDKLSSLGKQLGIKREEWNLTSEEYRVLLQYKIQEDFRQKEGLQIPKPIRDKIEGILLSKKDGILIRGVDDDGKGGDETMKKGSKEAKRKMAKVREAKKGNTGPKVGEIARKAISNGKGFEETLKLVKAAIPTSKFSKACYAWYKAHLKD